MGEIRNAHLFDKTLPRGRRHPSHRPFEPWSWLFTQPGERRLGEAKWLFSGVNIM